MLVKWQVGVPFSQKAVEVNVWVFCLLLFRNDVPDLQRHPLGPLFWRTALHGTLLQSQLLVMFSSLFHSFSLRVSQSSAFWVTQLAGGWGARRGVLCMHRMFNSTLGLYLLVARNAFPLIVKPKMSVQTLPDVPGRGSGAQNHPLLRITGVDIPGSCLRTVTHPEDHLLPEWQHPPPACWPFLPTEHHPLLGLRAMASVRTHLAVRGHGNQYLLMYMSRSKIFSGVFALVGYWLLDSSLSLLRPGFFACKTRTKTKPLPVLNGHSCWHSFLRTGFYKENDDIGPTGGRNRTDTLRVGMLGV